MEVVFPKDTIVYHGTSLQNGVPQPRPIFYVTPDAEQALLYLAGNGRPATPPHITMSVYRTTRDLRLVGLSVAACGRNFCDASLKMMHEVGIPLFYPFRMNDAVAAQWWSRVRRMSSN